MLQSLCYISTFTLFLFCGCKTTENYNVTIYVNKTVEISCSNETVLNVTDVRVNNVSNECVKQNCKLTESEINVIKNSCNKNTSCKFTFDPLDACFSSYSDLSVTYGCKVIAAGSCSFDDGTCGWFGQIGDISSGKFLWQIGSNSTGRRSTGPDKDHTSGSGSYMFSRSQNGARTDDETYLISPVINPSMKQCLSFWYHMYGVDIRMLSVYQYRNRTWNNLWNTYSNHVNKWFYQIIPINDLEPYRIVFVAVRGDGHETEIAIDDVVIANTECPVSKHDCNFETNTCLWTTTGEKQWIRHNESTPSTDTGPSFDHTLGTDTGYYMYMEATNLLNDDAVYLNSTSIMSSGDSCFTFWYHMYGGDIGILQVHLVQNERTNLLLEQEGHQGQHWKFAQITLTESETFIISIKGIRTDGWGSDIAIDDISLISMSCQDFEASKTTLEVGDGSTKYSETCVNATARISLEGCSTYYLLEEEFQLHIDSNFAECSDFYHNITNIKQFCSNITNNLICTINVQNFLQQRPECFFANRLTLQYNCEDKVTDIIGNFQSQVPTGTPPYGIIASAVLGLLLLASFVFAAVCFRRRMQHHRKNIIKEQRKNSTEDYTGNQNVPFWVPFSQTRDISGAAEIRKNEVEQQYYNLKDNLISLSIVNKKDAENKNKSNGTYNNIDTNYANTGNGTTLHKNTIETNNESGQKYVILDPEQTGYNRSCERLDGEFVTNNVDPYVVTEDGAYDSTIIIRHKDTDNNVYSHSIDNVYDSACHTSKREETLDTYDHFIGEKTEDNYDVTKWK